MGKRRVPKTLKGKLSDLDDHIFLLRTHLHGIKEDVAHVKAIAAELRTLVCFSGRREGLLWRLVDKVGVLDLVHVHLAGEIDTQHPLATNLQLAYIPIVRAGFGDPKLPPGYFSLRDIIKGNEAIFVSGKGLTHEYLIKAVSQQMGTAHEDDGIEPRLASLTQVFVAGIQPYIPILVMDAQLALEVGERLLEKAGVEFAYKRKPRPYKYGDTTIAIRCGLNAFLQEKVEVLSFMSYVSGVEIKCIAQSDRILFRVSKRGELVKVRQEDDRRLATATGGCVKEIGAMYPKNWNTGVDAVFAFLYSSSHRQARTITNSDPQKAGVDFDIGWLDARELVPSWNEKDKRVYRQLCFTWDELLSPSQCRKVLDLTQEDFDFQKHMNEFKEKGPFPTW